MKEGFSRNKAYIPLPESTPAKDFDTVNLPTVTHVEEGPFTENPIPTLTDEVFIPQHEVPRIVLEALRRKYDAGTEVRPLKNGCIEILYPDGTVEGIDFKQALKRVNASVNPELAEYVEPKPLLDSDNLSGFADTEPAGLPEETPASIETLPANAAIQNTPDSAVSLGLNREAANEAFPVPENVAVTEDFEVLAMSDIVQIERLKKESDKLNFNVATVQLLERVGYKRADTESVLKDGKYYINVTRDGTRSSFTNSQAIEHLKEIARRSKEFIAEEEGQKKIRKAKEVIVSPQESENPQGATSPEIREGNPHEPVGGDGFKDSAQDEKKENTLNENHIEEPRLLREGEIAQARSVFLKKYGPRAVQKETKEPPSAEGHEDRGTVNRDPYWGALNQHISPENYTTFGFDSDQTDAYWRAQQLTMNPEWANLSNEELLKKFEESRKDGKDVSRSEDLSVEAPPVPAHSPETPSAPEGGVDSQSTVQADAGAENMPAQVDTELPPPSLAKEDLPVLTDVVAPPAASSELPVVKGTSDPVPPDTLAQAVTPKVESLPQVREQSDIQKEVAYLEKVKSEVSSGSREFIEYAMKNDPEFKKAYEAAGGERGALSHMWIERRLGALKAEAKEMARSSPNYFDTRFEKQFGISKAELLKIEGFDKLSNGQQMLIFESLKEYTEDESRGKFGAMWAGVKGILGQTVETAPRKGATGIEAYRDFLAPLVMSATMYGPKVHIENGTAMPDFIGMGYDREYREKQKAACDVLNSAAHAFAQIPASWQEDGNGVHAKDESKITTFFKEKLFTTESRKNYRTYEASAKAFEDAQIQFAEALSSTGISDEHIVRKILEVDAKVHQLRFIETDPEAAEFLKSVPDKTFWEKVGGVVKAGGVYAGLGAVGRTMTGSALGVLSGPAVAATLAGTRAWNKTAAEQRERDRKARMGTEDTSAGALNIVQAKQEIKTSEGKKDMGVTAKLERLVSDFRNLGEDADPKERMRLLNQLRARTTYSQDKLKLNRIQFGDKKNFAVNQARFFEALANAQVLVFKEGGSPESRLDTRLEKYLEYREGAMNDRRHREARKRVLTASTVAAGMSLAGAYAAQEFIKSDMGGRTIERIKDGAERVGSWLTSEKLPVAEIVRSDVGVKEDLVAPVLEEDPVKVMTEADAEQHPSREQIEPLTPSGTVPLETVGTEPEVASAQTAPESQSKVLPQEDVEAVLEKQARALETKYISENIPPKEWERIRDDDAGTFIKRSVATSTFLEKYTSSSLMKGQPTQAQIHGRLAGMLDAAKQYGIAPTKGESVESFTHRVFSANEHIAEKERIMGLFGTSPETLPKGEMLPQSFKNTPNMDSPTSAERAEVQKLFSKEKELMQFKGRNTSGVFADALREPSASREVMPGIDAMNLKPGRVLEGHYIQNYLSMNDPSRAWPKVRRMPAELFVIETMERSPLVRQSPALIELGSVFNEIQKPPYNVRIRSGETMEVFMSRVFSVLTQADTQGTNTENMREFIREIATPRGGVRR